MLVTEFKDNCTQYEAFEVWDVENMDAFFKGNGVLAEVFKNTYKFPVENIKERRSEIPETNLKIMEKLLDQIGNKHFYIFTYHDNNHWELVQMQNMKIMNFGLNIEEIAKDHVYILIMDKKSEFTTMQI